MSTATVERQDTRWMRRALALAQQARGRTSPNPLVGAVIVRGDEMVGEGFHERAGAPHAEVVALGAAGEQAQGSTLYVTLEPCSHHGRVPPCAPAVIEAGVSRVVSAMEDPDPRVQGSGHRLLRDGGVAVDVGVLSPEAHRVNEEFVHRVRTGRAFLVVKAAVTLDGRLAADGGHSRWITGPQARAKAHELRDRYDAVLVGRGTLESDDPRLDVRDAGGKGRDPVAVVLDSGLRADLDRKLWQRAQQGARVLVATTEGASVARRAELESLGVQVLTVPADSAGRVDLSEVLRELGERGWNSVMIEGGEAVVTSALAAGLVNRMHVFVAPKILGGAVGPRFVGDLGIRRVDHALHLVDVEHEILGADILVSGRLETTGEDS